MKLPSGDRYKWNMEYYVITCIIFTIISIIKIFFIKLFYTTCFYWVVLFGKFNVSCGFVSI